MEDDRARGPLVSHPPRLPAPARWLLRLASRPRETHGEIEDDLEELFTARRRERGLVHAHWRLYRDLASLVRAPRVAARPVRRQSRLAVFRDAGMDLRYAARLFARQPAILLLAIVGLSLGLGIATAAFSIMNAAVLRGEGLVDPDGAPGVVRVTDRSTSTTWAYDEFLRLREGATRMRVEAVVTDSAQVRAASTDAEPPSAGLAFVSGGFFAATGGRVAAGRALEPADERHAGPPPAVVSHAYWRAALGADPDVIGRTIRIGRADATIVGVAEGGFLVPNNRSFWLPLSAYGAVYGGQRTPATGLQVFGRLLPDAAPAEAAAQLSGVAAALQTPAAGDSPLRVQLDPEAGLGRSSSADTMAIAATVFVVIGLVLVLACANVATVLVSAAITREREMGVRAALGASRGRLVRQLVTESLALGSVAAMVGVMVAQWAMPLIARMIDAPAGYDLAPDVTVYVFLALVTLATGVGAGLAPALHGRGTDLVSPLKGEARQRRLAPKRLRSLLLMTQSAVAVVLIVMAALFVRATTRSAAIDAGFDAAGVYAVSAGLGYGSSEAQRSDFWTRAFAEAQAVQGVAAVTLTELSPFTGNTRTSVDRQDPSRVVHVHLTGPEYFDTLGIRTLTGRTYTREETAATAPVAVVSESLARAYWPGQSPLGQMLPPQIPMASARPVVIGVVADTITARLHERNRLSVYTPLGPGHMQFAELLIKVAPGTTGAIDDAVRRLRALDPQASVRIASVAGLLEQEASRPRTLAVLTGIVGLVAIVLCVIGLYGLTASVVAQRTKEMAVRAAIGADARRLLRLLVWDSLKPVALGLAAGVAVTLVAGRVVVASMFFNVPPDDPIALAGAVAMLLAAALVAVLVPARRAARVDAAVVLKGS